MNQSAMPDLDTQAKALYERNTNGSAPRWEQLGDITKGVWREEYEKAFKDSINTGTGIVKIQGLKITHVIMDDLE